MPSTRTFLAIHTPPDVVDSLRVIQNKLREASADVRWESPEKLHITVRFLGDVDDRSLPNLIQECADEICYLPSFSLIYRGLGCFPDFKNPRIVWAGSENADGNLIRMKRKIDEIVGHYGFEPEKRAFHPHITLGRVKGNRNIRNLITMLQNVTFEAHEAEITGIHIMKSELRPSGSIYTTLHTIALRSANG